MTMRRPTRDEIRAMTDALDQFLDDERTSQGHRCPHHGCLYAPHIEAHMQNCIDGKPIDPELMWRVLDALDAFHRQITASPRHYARDYARARHAVRDLMEVG